MKVEGSVDLAALAKSEADRLMPDGLTDEEEYLWSEIAPELYKRHRLEMHYLHTVHEYVAALAELREYRAYLRANGETYSTQTRNGLQIKTRPEVGQRNEAFRRWRALANDLGLNPQAERSLGGAVRDLFDDPADEFLA